MKRYTDIHDQVNYGLEKIDEDTQIQVNLKDMLYVYQTLGELVRYLHQPLHYPTLKSIMKWIGNEERGIFREVSECYYSILKDVFPKEIEEMFDEGEFDNPNPPFYYSEEKEAIENLLKTED
jgi:hypothetical protein